jgi:hypothetical protein
MLSLLLAKLAPYFAGFVALLAALGGIILSAKRSGVKQEQSAEATKALQQAKDANENVQAVRNLSDDDLAKRLRVDQRD